MTNKNNKGAQDNLLLRPIAYIQNGFDEKFGIPRQSGLAQVRSEIRFVPEFRDSNAVRGIEGFNYLWLIWCFSGNMKTSSAQLSSNSNPDSRELSFLESGTFRPTVRPPRLGGNTHMGVFATRSPFRPNPLGLSAVRIEEIDEDNYSIRIRGVDLVDGTPVYDIKPYLPYADAKPEALSGFAPDPGSTLEVIFSPGTEERIPPEKRASLMGVLRLDPRPPYQNDPERVYTMTFGDQDIRFTVRDDTLHVVAIKKL